MSQKQTKNEAEAPENLPLLSLIPPPEHLSEAAKTEWIGLFPAIVATQTATFADLRAVELLAETLATTRTLQDLLSRDGMTVPTGADGIKPHPCLRSVETARGQAAKLLEAFGLVPKARAGAGGVRPPRTWEPWEG